MAERHYCAICGERADIALGIRARYANTNAVWAPNLGVYLCGPHSKCGIEIDVHLKKVTDTGHVAVDSFGPRGKLLAHVALPINRKEPPDQLWKDDDE